MRSAKRTLGLIVLAAIVPLAGIAAGTPPPTHHTASRGVAPRPTRTTDHDVAAEALVRDAIASYQRVSFVGQLSSIRSGTNRAYAVVEQVEHRAPDQTRRTYLAPQSLYGQYVITRGAMSWDIDPKSKRVVVTENRAADDAVVANDDIELLNANYRAVLAADDDNVADRRAEVVDLVNRYTGQRLMRLWIDERMHVVLAKEEYHGDGSLAWRTRYDAIRFTGALPKQIFTADLPKEFTTTRGRAYGHPSEDLTRAISECGFTPIGPKYLPEGFAVVTADLADIKGVKNLHLLYTDGIRMISLFENATNRAVDFGALKPHTTTFDGHSAQYARDGPTTLLAWHEHDLDFALVADLELKDLTRIASSVVP